MLSFDECRLMLDQSINTHDNAPRQGVLYLYPENIEEYHEQVRKNGLDIPELDVTFYGMREFRLFFIVRRHRRRGVGKRLYTRFGDAFQANGKFE